MNGCSIPVGSEEWRVIPGFPDYQVSNLGRMLSMRRSKPKIIAAKRNSGRYIHATLCNGANKRAIFIHRAVAWAFLGPQEPGTHVAHNNGDSYDNRLCNLRYATAKENMADMKLHGTFKRRSVNPELIESRMVLVREVDTLIENGITKTVAYQTVGISLNNYFQWKRNWLAQKNFTSPTLDSNSADSGIAGDA